MARRAYEPFAYIDEENVGHLWHLLAMSKTEPWVIDDIQKHGYTPTRP